MTAATSQGNKQGHPHHAIRIENIPLNVNRREVIALFNTLIGDVRGSSDVMAASGSHLEIYFHSPDAAKKALCMSGYTIAGTALIVTTLESTFGARPKPPAHTRPQDSHHPDDRRNLYVLGLPYDLTKNEFTAVFSRYGTVSHCVVLATVDNSSRRRGFVVMSNHEEAKRAMASLTRTQIRGHAIDISWAIVQRSQGFLDGGDRTLFLDPRSPCSSPPDSSQDDLPALSPDTSDSSIASSGSPRPDNLLISHVPSATLLVANLPTLLFSQTQDLHPLFVPYGEIKKLEVVRTSLEGTTTVIVEYSSINSATDAKGSLDGQPYLNLKVNIDYLFCPSQLPQDPIDATPLDITVAPGRSLPRPNFYHDPRATQDFSQLSRPFQHCSLRPYGSAPLPTRAYSCRPQMSSRPGSTNSIWSTGSSYYRPSSATQFIAAPAQPFYPNVYN